MIKKRGLDQDHHLDLLAGAHEPSSDGSWGIVDWPLIDIDLL